MAFASALATILSGNVQESRAGVFQQTCNGQVIALGSGARQRAPLQPQAGSRGGGEAVTPTSIIDFGPSHEADHPVVPAGALLAADASPPSSICAKAPAGATSKGLRAIKAVQETLSLPSPRRLSQKLTDSQLEMRELAAKVGAEFADAPGVARAKLDQPTFVKLFTTLVHRESNFRPRAVSPAGARGLGQLMPATARYLGVKDSFAPEQNLAGAATYLTEMLDQFGSPELALAAYNAGPNAVSKYDGIPPYRETRQYVADIFNEVLREPIPADYEAERLTDVARRGLAAFVAATGSADIDETPFDIVLADKTDQPQKSHKHGLLAFADSAENATLTKASLGPSEEEAKAAAAPNEDVGVAAKKAPSPEKTSNGTGQAAGQSSLDLSDLPEPREFGDALLKSQLAMRELAIDIALRHAKAPGVAKAKLSEKEFVTLFVALIRRESSFNHRAVSPDGAKGLGQLMPETAHALGLKNPFSAEDNLEASATRLTQFLDQFGSSTLALAAYNAGEDALLDRTVIPKVRNTRQLIADVLYDLESDPLPDFVMARFEKTDRTDVAQAGDTRLAGELSGPAGQDLLTTDNGSVAASQSAWVSLDSPALANATLLDELLAALKWAVGEVILALQSLFSGGSPDDVPLALSWGGMRDASAGTEASSPAPGTTAAKLPTADRKHTTPVSNKAAHGLAVSETSLPDPSATPRIPERLDASGEPASMPVKKNAVNPAKSRTPKSETLEKEDRQRDIIQAFFSSKEIKK